MELRVLRYFLAVAHEQSISAAAENLHISQPTLSRQLMDMEEDLGKQLFLRGNRRITLTEEGMLLKSRAEEIIDLVDKTEAELKTEAKNISGDIFIGAGETDAMRLFAKTARALQAEHPGIRFHIFSGNAEEITDRLDKGLIDLGLLIDPKDTAKYEALSLPVSDTWGVLMRKDSPLSENDTIDPKDLWDLPLILSAQAAKEKSAEKLLDRKLDKLNIAATYNLIYNASLLVEEGLGYALCLDKLVRTGENSALCFKPLEPQQKALLTVVWKKNQVFSKAAALFLRELSESIYNYKA